jgi:CRISPR-associated protein Cas1
VLAAGYAPAVGFIHTGKPLSFVYDIADLFKFDGVVPLAFRIAAKLDHQRGDIRRAEGEVRRACRDHFRERKLLAEIIPTIEEMLSAGGVAVPTAEGVVEPAFTDPSPTGDAGHRG